VLLLVAHCREPGRLFTVRVAVRYKLPAALTPVTLGHWHSPFERILPHVFKSFPEQEINIP